MPVRRFDFLRSVILLLSLLLVGCGGNHQAPVVNAWQQSSNKASRYTVQQGDTIYSVAWSFGLDYRSLAQANGIAPPYHLRVGQRLTMIAPEATPPNPSEAFPSLAEATPSRKTKPNVSYRTPDYQVTHWRWPARGKVSNQFDPSLAGNKGIDIHGRQGQPILAAGAGTVVYSNDKIRGYGNLIIIKHNKSMLSAYAHNQANLVRIGQHVRAGQRIALMGRNNAGQILLHFELRKNGKPVNPMQFLR